MSNLLILRYVPLSQVELWENNPKKHDLPALVEAFYEYGFQDPPKFDAALNEGRGGLTEGNGRIEALRLAQQTRPAPPKGIGLTDAGEWAVPLLFGNDLPSQAVAEAYAIDHNHLTVMGGGFTGVYLTQLWDDVAYTRRLIELEAQNVMAVTVTIDPDEPARQVAAPPPKTTVRVTLGPYSFEVDRLEYESWKAALLAELGTDDREMVIIYLKQKLQLEDA